ncbi:hypothetical protein [Natribaculum luteum]|uniref:hypothetical protein n=1 Tax=Natribaculum luteum TaxID=1586232 RepID=UPI001FF6089F|nr:hypothetical protein [Natribaculum luteum]
MQANRPYGRDLGQIIEFDLHDGIPKWSISDDIVDAGRLSSSFTVGETALYVQHRTRGLVAIRPARQDTIDDDNETDDDSDGDADDTSGNDTDTSEQDDRESASNSSPKQNETDADPGNDSNDTDDAGDEQGARVGPLSPTTPAGVLTPARAMPTTSPALLGARASLAVRSGSSGFVAEHPVTRDE